MVRLTVKRFDPTGMKPHRIILLVGKRGTGKSVLMEDLMYHLRDRLDFGLAMTPTESTAECFRKHMPDQWIYPCFDAGKVDSMLNIQRDSVKKKRPKSLFIAMDDCMFDKKCLKSLAMRDLFFNGRHLHVTLMNAMQYVMDMGPDLRSQCDYCFILKENILSNKVRLYKYFFGMFDTFKDFSRVLEKCTENHCALVLDNTAPSNRLEDSIFWYRADPDIGSFRLGKEKYWALARLMHKNDDKRREEEREQRAMEREKHERSAKKMGISHVRMHDEHGESVSSDEDVVMG